jgi:hypothetical protein
MQAEEKGVHVGSDLSAVERGSDVKRGLPSWGGGSFVHQAEEKGVRVGDTLVGINDMDLSMRHVPLKEILSIVQAQPDEVTLTFIRGTPRALDTR